MSSKNAPQSYDAAVVIGRFQPFHNGHLALIEQALAKAPTVIVVLGSAHAARSTKNPFTWRERAQMIKLAVGERANRIHFLPVRDYYDDIPWVEAVRLGVARLAPNARDIVLIGHQKDATSYYLNQFPTYALEESGRRAMVEATSLRRVLFSGASPAAVLAGIEEHVPPAVLDYLTGWSELPFLSKLTQDWKDIRSEREKWAGAPYAPVFVTVDAVVRCARHILLVRRARNPGAGLWALPGGFVEPNERLIQAALRELREETRIGVLQSTLESAFRGVQVFDHPQRSLRGRTITHAHFFDIDSNALPSVSGDDDAEQARWFPLEEVAGLESELFEDHAQIIDSFLGVLPD